MTTARSNGMTADDCTRWRAIALAFAAEPTAVRADDLAAADAPGEVGWRVAEGQNFLQLPAKLLISLGRFLALFTAELADFSEIPQLGRLLLYH